MLLYNKANNLLKMQCKKIQRYICIEKQWSFVNNLISNEEFELFKKLKMLINEFQLKIYKKKKIIKHLLNKILLFFFLIIHMV